MALRFEPSRFFFKGRMRQNTNIHSYMNTSEQKLVRCEMNTRKRYKKQSQLLVLGPDKRGINFVRFERYQLCVEIWISFMHG